MAEGAQIGSGYVDIGGNLANLEAALRDGERQVERFVKNANDNMRRIGSGLGSQTQNPLKHVEESINRTTDATNKFESQANAALAGVVRSFQQLNATIGENSNKQNAAFIQLVERMKTIGGATDRAGDSTKRHGGEIEKLVRKYDKVYAAQLDYLDALRQIKALESGGKIDVRLADNLRLGATDQYLDTLKKTKGQTQELNTVSGFLSKNLRLVGVAAAAAALYGLQRMVKSSFENATALKDSAAQLGVNVEQLQAYRYAAEQSGVSVSEFDRSIEFLSRSIGKAALGAERESEAFRLLGVSLKNADGSAKSAGQAFPELADALLRIRDANQRAAVAQILFGESATKMLPLLNKGSEGIRELTDAADELGIVMSAERIERLDEANKKFDAMNKILGTKIASVVADNSEEILGLADALMALARAAIQVVGWVGAAWRKLGELDRQLGSDFESLAKRREQSYGKAQKQFNEFLESQRPEKQPKPKPKPKPAPKSEIDVSNFLANENRSRTPRSPRAPRDRTLQVERDLERVEIELLNLQKELTTTVEGKLAIDKQILKIRMDSRTAQIDYQLAEKQITAAQAKELKAAYNRLDAAQDADLEYGAQQALLDERLAIAENQRDLDLELWGLEKQLRRTRKGQLEAAQEILKIQIDSQKAELQRQLDNEKLGDIERQILLRRQSYLSDIANYQEDLLEEQYMGPVEQFMRSLGRSEAEIKELAETYKAELLEDARQRSVALAEDISGALTNVARGILNLEDPIDVLRAAIFELASIFNEEVLLRPLQEMISQKVGRPLAEQATGMPATPYGLPQEVAKQVENEAAKMASGFSTISGQMVTLGSAATTSAAEMQTGVATMTTTVTTAGQTLQTSFTAVTTAANQAAQALAMVGGGGGGGGSLLSSVLGVAAGAVGSAAPNAALVGSVEGAMAANPGIFHEGGEIGTGGKAIRRNSEIDIRAKVGEYVIPEGPTVRFRRELDMMRTGKDPFKGLKAPQMALGGNLRGMANPAPASSTNNFNMRFDSSAFPSITDPRQAREAGRQFASGFSARIAKAAKAGVIRRD